MNSVSDILDWYEGKEQPTDAPATGASVEKTVSIEQEIAKDSEEQEKISQEREQEEDKVLMTEYENCIKAIGISEFLRNKLSNYLAMTQVSDFDSLKKDEMKNEIKYIVDELSKITAEL